ncbi:fimbrillin family protein [Prevotella herbatica]|uniref:receptor protein-tyrosine kinase n=2 Tax=Prevotella herbatica TaxID=2801997 RepID=A0ABN6ELI7_9BACT|nr:fimbrillin family protein [Prevotella herbatica]
MNMLDGNNNEQINFFVSVPSWKGNDSIASNSAKTETRATPITDASLGTDKTFGIIADVVNGSNYITEINQEVVSYNTTNKIWETVADHYWPGANKTVNFYAYYPASITNGTITHTASTTPILTYTVPADATTQVDIMTATGTNVSGNSNSSTPLSFNHIFAAIQFSVGSAGIGSGTISSISIGNVANSGTYTFGSGWSNVTGSKTFTISQSKTITGISGEDIYSGNYTLMMVPQNINNITITISYSNGGTLTKTISGTWEAGKVYKYHLSYAPKTFDYTGTVQTYTIPVTGTYKLEVWGAQGGGGGYGGYAFGNIYLTQSSLLYFCIGGAGTYNLNGSILSNPLTAGYNGGGYGQCGGGGATHIAITNRGVLKNYLSYQAEILLVAGGGGGGDGTPVGVGGGTTGGDGTSSGSGGTQTTGGTGIGSGSFGQGGNIGTTNNDSAGAGGGGWYGGGSSGQPQIGSGGGGSGHIGTSLISGSTGMSNGVRSGDGYARITFVSAN